MSIWTSIPPLKSLDQYITAIQDFPMLTPEEELECGTKKDELSIMKLVLSHLRLGASMARKMSKTHIPEEDLIQEANMGLLRAAQTFDPNAARFSTYATHYVRSAILEYIIKNWRTVNFVKTKSQRKLFNNLWRAKWAIVQEDRALRLDEAGIIAEQLNVSVHDVKDMEMRMMHSDMSIDVPYDADDNDQSWEFPDMNQEPSRLLEENEAELVALVDLPEALATLTDRERFIIQQRYLSDEKMGLWDLGAIFGISGERVRQIEVNTMKKLRNHLTEYA